MAIRKCPSPDSVDSSRPGQPPEGTVNQTETVNWEVLLNLKDVAIRMHPPKQPDLIQRHLLSMQWHVCASPIYLKKHGVPQRPEELDAHKLILFGSHHPPVPEINWLAEAGRRPGSPRRALLEVNSIIAMQMTIRSDLNITTPCVMLLSTMASMV